MKADDGVSLSFIDIMHSESGSVCEVRSEGKGAVGGFICGNHRTSFFALAGVA